MTEPAPPPVSAPSRAAIGSAGEFRRGWRALVACGAGLAFGLSPIAPYASGILAGAMQKELGWARADILAVLMLAPIVLVLLGRHVGRLIDKVGPRKVAIASTIGLGFSELLVAAIGSTLPGYYLAWGVLALLSIGTLPMTYAKLLNGWFDHARGLALGLALAATGLAGVIMPFMMTAAIHAMGWRGGYLALAFLPLVIAVPVLLAWLREAPQIAPGAEGHASISGVTVREALRGYRFWALAFAALVLAFGVSGLVPNLFSLLLERGIPEASAASALAALAISVTAGRVLSGFLLDRLWAPIVCAVLVLPAVAALVLLVTPGLGGGVVIGAVVMLGLVAGAEFDLVAFMTARYFGQRHFSELYGIQYAAFGIGAGSAPAAYGALHDRLGSYDPTVQLSIVLMLVAVAIIFTLGRYPREFAAAH
ncbi:MFS transporter [Novosphingobium barchaimii]|nr:MFS transporter [Novosphingobium barchaimii]